MENTAFLCVGEDKRFVHMCDELSKTSTVFAFGMTDTCERVKRLSSLEDMTKKADVLILPFMKGFSDSIKSSDMTIPLAELAGCVKSAGLVLGGMLRDEHIKLFGEYGLEAVDYFDNESLVLKNCIPTAEGTLQLALSQTDITIFGSNVLITGYGRTAEKCAELFDELGARCTVAARSPSARSKAWCRGFNAVDINDMNNCLSKFDIIINTVPAMIFDCERLALIEKSTVLIDIASMPGGVDFEAAKQFGVKTFHALALPGKTAPVTSGIYIAQTVLEILSERGRIDVK